MVLFFRQSQSPTECHVSFTLLAHAPAVQTFYASIHPALYMPFMIFSAGRMNSKSKNKICKKIIEEVCKENDGAQEFIADKVKGLRSQEGILIDEVRRWFKANLFLLSF